MYGKVLSEGADRQTDRCPELPEYIIHQLQDPGIIDGEEYHLAFHEPLSSGF